MSSMWNKVVVLGLAAVLSAPVLAADEVVVKAGQDQANATAAQTETSTVTSETTTEVTKADKKAARKHKRKHKKAAECKNDAPAANVDTSTTTTTTTAQY